MTTTTSYVTEAQARQYREEGYFILPAVLPEEHLQILRDGAQYAIDTLNARMDAEGVDILGIATRNKRYFAEQVSRELPQLRTVLFSEIMADVCRATVGEDAYLFWEQYVIKASDPDTTFAWHQDSGYVHENHDAYVTLWIALDDIDERNGAVSLLPYSRTGIRSYIKHIKDPVLNHQVCYFGDDPGIPVYVPAGSIVVFSSLVIHRSGANLTDRYRRAFTTSYSHDVIMSADGSKPYADSELFLKDGRRVVTG